MANRPLFSDFLIALPAVLQAISRRMLRAIATLIARVVAAVRVAVRAIIDILVRFAKRVWEFYCRLELSIVESLVTVALVAWSLRLLALILAPAIILAVLSYWIVAIAYATFLALAIWKFYSARSEDIEQAIEEQKPIRDLLKRIFRIIVRVTLVVASIVSVAVFFFSARIPSLVANFRELGSHAPSSTAFSSEQQTAPPGIYLTPAPEKLQNSHVTSVNTPKMSNLDTTSDGPIAAKFCGIWEYDESGSKHYLRVIKQQDGKFKFFEGYKYQGKIIWPEPTITNADGIYLQLQNGKLNGEFSSDNFRATHGLEFGYKVTLDLTANNRLFYSVWISTNGTNGRTEKRDAIKISD